MPVNGHQTQLQLKLRLQQGILANGISHSQSRKKQKLT